MRHNVGEQLLELYLMPQRVWPPTPSTWRCAVCGHLAGNHEARGALRLKCGVRSCRCHEFTEPTAIEWLNEPTGELNRNARQKTEDPR